MKTKRQSIDRIDFAVGCSQSPYSVLSVRHTLKMIETSESVISRIDERLEARGTKMDKETDTTDKTLAIKVHDDICCKDADRRVRSNHTHSQIGVDIGRECWPFGHRRNTNRHQEATPNAVDLQAKYSVDCEAVGHQRTVKGSVARMEHREGSKAKHALRDGSQIRK